MPESSFTSGNQITTTEIDQDSPATETLLTKIKERDVEVMDKVIGEGARVYHNANQNVPTAPAAVAFNTERYDANALHDTVTNNSRLTCKKAGKYLIYFNYSVTIQGSAGDDATFYIRLNGATNIVGSTKHAVTGGAITYWGSAVTVYDLAVNDYVEIIMDTNSAAAVTLLSTANYSPEFGMQRLGD